MGLEDLVLKHSVAHFYPNSRHSMLSNFGEFIFGGKGNTEWLNTRFPQEIRQRMGAEYLNTVLSLLNTE